jgi:hypothetical protein
VPDGVRLLTNPDEVVVTVVEPRVHEEAAPAPAVEGAPAEGAPAEGAAAAEAAPATSAVGKPKKAESDKA